MIYMKVCLALFGLSSFVSPLTVPNFNFQFALPDTGHKEAFEPHEQEAELETVEKAKASINMTAVEERIATIEEEIRNFNLGTVSTSSASSSSVAQLNDLIRQVSEKETSLQERLSALATKLDASDAALTSTEEARVAGEDARAAKAADDTSTVTRLSQTYSDVELMVMNVEGQSNTTLTEIEAMETQIDGIANGPAAAMAAALDQTSEQVLEHSESVTDKEASLDGHCVAVDLQGQRMMLEAASKVVKNDHLRTIAASMSSQEFGTVAENIIDGNLAASFFDRSSIQTRNEANPWCFVKLARTSVITGAKITSRGDCCHDNIYESRITIHSKDPVEDGYGEFCASIGKEMGPGETRLYSCYKPITGQWVRIQRDTQAGNLQLVELQVMGTALSAVEGKAAIQSSTDDAENGAMMAIDSDPSTCSMTRDYDMDKAQDWMVDLGESYYVTGVTVTNRMDQNYSWMRNVQVDLFQTFPDSCSQQVAPQTCTTGWYSVPQGYTVTLYCQQASKARYVRISLAAQSYGKLSLCEVEVLTA